MASAKHCPPALVQSVLDEGEFHQDQADLENLDFKVRVWGWVAYFWSQVLWSWFTLSSVSVFSWLVHPLARRAIHFIPV